MTGDMTRLVLLANVASKVMLQSYSDVPTTWPTFCDVASDSDFKTAYKYRLIGIGQFEEIGAAGQITPPKS